MDDSKTRLSDIATLRQNAREHLENGAVTTDYRADRKQVLRLLNEALATEIVCWLRYRRHYFMAKGIHAEVAAAEFLEHSNQEAGHADLLAARIVQLRGQPDFSPDGMAARSHAEYVAGETLKEMLQEDLVAERIAIASYGEVIRHLGSDDPTTRTLLERILATEEEHADDLAALLDGIRS
jgi:bacterioferritin